MQQVCTQLKQLSQVMATSSMAGRAHLTFGLAACSAAQVEESPSGSDLPAAAARKLYLLAPELQQEPSWCPVSLPPARLSFRRASPACCPCKALLGRKGGEGDFSPAPGFRGDSPGFRGGCACATIFGTTRMPANDCSITVDLM